MNLKVLPKTMTDGYESWWNVGLAQVSEKESVREAWKGVEKTDAGSPEHIDGRYKQWRRYLDIRNLTAREKKS